RRPPPTHGRGCLPSLATTCSNRSSGRGDEVRAPRCGGRFASPHAVRRSLTDPLESSALFGGVFRCVRLDYHRLTPHIMKRCQIPFPQVGRSHNPLVAGSSPARPTAKSAAHSRFLTLRPKFPLVGRV